MKENKTKNSYKLFNDFSDKHFEKFAPLTPSNRLKIQELLQSASGNCYKEAEIHTGIPAVELAINEYLTKHTLPMKIKEAVDVLKSVERAIIKQKKPLTWIERPFEQEKNDIIKSLIDIVKKIMAARHFGRFKVYEEIDNVMKLCNYSASWINNIPHSDKYATKLINGLKELIEFRRKGDYNDIPNKVDELEQLVYEIQSNQNIKKSEKIPRSTRIYMTEEEEIWFSDFLKKLDNILKI